MVDRFRCNHSPECRRDVKQSGIDMEEERSLQDDEDRAIPPAETRRILGLIMLLFVLILITFDMVLFPPAGLDRDD